MMVLKENKMKKITNWEILPDGTPLKKGDGFQHPETGLVWIDYECRPDLFRGDKEYVHSGWQWRRKVKGK